MWGCFMEGRLLHASVGVVFVVGIGFALSMSLLLAAQTAAQESRASTPRTTSGKPNLSGMWSPSGGFVLDGFTNQTEEDGDIVRLFPSRRCAPNQIGCRDNTNQANDYEFIFRTDPNRPPYRPEHWDKVQQLDYDTNFSDPMFRCYPEGVPRIGPPHKIVQTANEVIFLYAGRDHDSRIIPIDGRGHDPDAFPGFYGDAVGRWDGDTLVVDAVGFNDITWLASTGGYFHSYDLRVIERFRRDGDTLHYQVMVEDPEVLLKPWVMNARELRLNPDPKAALPERVPCRDYDEAITVSRIRH